ncbi:3-oxoadipyl-CoA thiolase [Roseibium album]|uniref:Beta-ketoadipyl-CoA thiolase n=1 Tax=Roseibium album TaxID=311410 RepID=A0A0M7ALX5_9HYPH|nr:3-oxoadipyl-CoA thiolase [Roseibium album]CTQ61734.1 3-oxoadipyl-CoA/3-oxo-5,6-dehydrosuberyl-CoA thiolase [Roseibium album]CTQ75426.1 3-oxoadipyl-CoA/3-oxo-5,6-dehydrosuberyl-CoA thiolase [Roseibium album]CTQ78410.1 3-oxoadipyl-CoA/3-oxo-5,6-dehydrosuberyl-CoA thiolase [Roseibium album]
MHHVYICDYVRTPIGRYGGILSSVRTDDLGAIPIEGLMERNQDVDWAALDDVFFGCANQAGEDNRNVARMSALLAGLPDTVPGLTLNRLCGSGMDAVMTAARAIKSGEMDLAIAGGVESMSRAPMVMPKADTAFSRKAEIFDTTIGWRFVNPLLKRQYGIDSMPETAENVAEDFSISRADQDVFALKSQQKAEAARKNGRLAEEIIPVMIPQRKGDPILADKDEHPRAGTTLDMLSGLKTPFRENGSVTAGNASGVNDGAAALLIASETAIEKNNLRPIARIVGGATAGVPPRIMGIGPAPATRKLCARFGVSPSDFDVVELNEAFAAQAVAVMRDLGLPEDSETLNPNGGAIALGHPLGMSGARIVGSAALELKKRSGKLALATMCIGVGQGIALAIAAP